MRFRVVSALIFSAATLALSALHGCSANGASGEDDSSSGGGDASIDGAARDGSAADAAANEAGSDGGPLACAAPSGFMTSGFRGGNADVLPLSGYDYAPAIVETPAKTYQAWWCGANPIGGDEIRYAEAASLDGPWHAHGSATSNTFDVALLAGGNGTAFFDTTDACDPSVVVIGGTYYLYYGGNGAPWTGAPNDTTQIGVASSPTGLPGTWTKLASEQPIVKPYVNGGSANYGAGQPSVIVVSDQLYLFYTDVTEPGGQGMFVLRTSLSDPTFQSPGVQTFDGFGFVPRATTVPVRVSEQVNDDWAWSDQAAAFVMATTDGFTKLRGQLFDPISFASLAAFGLSPAGNGDGPGIVKLADGHLPYSGLPGVLAVDLLRAECYASAGDTTDCSADPYGNAGGNISLWDLAHAGIDVAIDLPAACEVADPTLLPSVTIDAPAAGTTVSGTIGVGGWAIDNTTAATTAIDPSSIEIRVDGTKAATATYGGNRPDVCDVYPGRAGCPNVGFNGTLDVSALAPGKHTITVVAKSSGIPARIGATSVAVVR